MLKLSTLKIQALLLVIFVAPVFAQEKEESLFDLSLEELMNITIVSASQEEETLFDAPVTSYSITKEEIAKSGVASIPEALRLCPGVIVRETTNGNYDIHLRGFDNPVRYTETAFQINVLTLVMINNMPVFSNAQGGTYWESLPIDLIDVERIEVVSGPAAPLFGPNAVTGVVNIITKDFKSKDWYASGNVQAGTPASTIGNFALGKKINNKLNVAFSGNYQNRNRHDDQYYLYYHDTYVDHKEFRAQESIDREMALNKAGVNGYINYRLNDNINFDLSLGTSQGEAQKVHFLDSIPLVFTHMKTNYLNFSGKVHGLNARVSYMSKVENLLNREAALSSSAYDLNTLDASVDYQWNVSDKIKIRPAINVMQSTFDDLGFAAEKPMGALLNIKESINSMGASLRADVYPVEDLRLVASARSDKFNIKDQPTLSYQFLATYKIQDKWLVRAVHSNSKSGLYYAHSFMDLSYPIPMPDGSTMAMRIITEPNDFDLVSNTMTEFGIRSQIAKSLQLDVTLFAQKLDNISDLLYDESRGMVIEDGVMTTYLTQQNLPFELQQKGATLAVNYVPSSKLQFKPFITFQQTNTEHFYNLRSMVPEEPKTREHDSTPTFYGGIFANYIANSRLNINLNGYFYGDQIMYHAQDAMIQTKENEIKGKMLVNSKVSYRVYSKFYVYLGGRNLLNQNSREYYGTDRIGRSFYVGASYNF